MSKLSVDDIQKLSCEERYEIFLSLVSEDREIWILVNNDKAFLKIHSQDADDEFIPIWPTQELAESYNKSANETLKAKALSLPEFFTKWVPGLEKDNLLVGVFPISGSDVWIMEPDELKGEIQEELNNTPL